jgi:ComF family protein
VVDVWTKFIRPRSICLICGKSSQDTCCEGCRESLPWNDSACARCGVALPVPRAVCGACIKSPPAFDAAVCAFRYEFPINRLLVDLKFRGRLGHARGLGELLAEHVVRCRPGERPGAILPAPLGTARARERGFNQAAEIARELARQLKLPVATGLVERRRDTAPQSSLSAAARRRNVRGAFVIKRVLPSPNLAIVDDVVTTGATAGELARILRAAGARRVVLFSAARA